MKDKGKSEEKDEDGGKERGFFFKKKAKSAGKKVEEAYNVAVNVLDYVDYMRVGPVLAETATRTDNNGNITDLRVPSTLARNEAKSLSFDWKTLNHNVKNLREQALSLHEDQEFCKAAANLHRQNRLSNAQGMEEIFTAVVRQWPQVIYATQNELAQIIGEALKMLSVSSFDDEACEFLAEGILRNAHKTYEERVSQILHLASAPKCEENTDCYVHFQEVAEHFYARVDEKFALEKKVFSDLYESIRGIYESAQRQGDDGLCQTTATYCNDIAAVLNEEAKPDLELAEEAADWLRSFIETNLESGTWTVSNKPHITVTGDHPEMAKKASKPYSPSADFSGKWGDELPMIGQDSMEYKSGKHSKEARSRSWGNESGPDIFPKLHNPNTPKPFGDYTMKGEKGADKDVNQGLGSWKSKSTWPDYQNPYVPKAETPKTWKMNKGKEKDLVVDK